MPLTKADYEVLYARATTIEFQESPGLLGLCNTSYLQQATTGRGHEVIIQDVTFGNVGSSDEVVGRGNMTQTWGAANSLALAQIRVEVNRQLRSDPVSLFDYDENGVAIDLDGVARQKISNALQVRISRAIADYWASLAAYTTFEPA